MCCSVKYTTETCLSLIHTYLLTYLPARLPAYPPTYLFGNVTERGTLAVIVGRISPIVFVRQPCSRTSENVVLRHRLYNILSGVISQLLHDYYYSWCVYFIGFTRITRTAITSRHRNAFLPFSTKTLSTGGIVFFEFEICQYTCARWVVLYARCLWTYNTAFLLFIYLFYMTVDSYARVFIVSNSWPNQHECHRLRRAR